MLFRDQCVAKGIMSPMVETDTTVTYQGYKVEVNGSPVTELRIFRNKTAQEYEIGIDNCLQFDWDIVNVLEAVMSPTMINSYGSATINAALRLFTVTVNKETGVITESSSGVVNFNEIIDGYFANFAPNVQGPSDTVLLSCNYSQNGVYHVPDGAIALITTYGSATITGGVGGSSSGYTIWNLTSMMGAQREVDFVVSGTMGEILRFRITKTILVDGSNNNINSGSVGGSNLTNTYNICPSQRVWSDIFQGEEVEGGGTNSGNVYFASVYNNVFFENIRGGLESVAAINVSSVSASANRGRVILERKTWQPSSPTTPIGSVVDPKMYKFAKHYGRVQGFITKQYEFFTATIDDLFLNSMATCRRAFILGGGNAYIDTMMQGYIDGVSASHEEFQDGYKAWRVSFNFTQEIGLEN